MIREAKFDDAESIQNLIRIFSENGKVLFRSLDEIRANINDFRVYEKNNRIVGIYSLKVGWGRLIELRSLVVDPRYSGQGLGTSMIEESIKIALLAGSDNLFVLTYAVSMFARLGFGIVDKQTLPHKVWSDCKNCLHQTNCDETAMVLSLVSLRHRHSILMSLTGEVSSR